jgi:ATP-dependent DNA helicase RecQ
MGIDKPDVRFVVHMDLPESPEAYFQEAGRGGRDEKKSFAVLLYNKADIVELQRNHQNSYPPISFIKKVYNCLGNYFQVPVGSAKDVTFSFNLTSFADNFSLNPILAYNSLKFLEREGYLAMSDALQNPSRIFIPVNKEDLYRFQVSSKPYDDFIKVLLRSYSGLFSEFVKINEEDIAKRAKTSLDETVKKLKYLNQVGMLEYEPQNDQPTITFITERLDEKNLDISPAVYHDRKNFAKQRMEAMKSYVESKTNCRSTYLLGYFGEHVNHLCGQCDTCLEKRKTELSAKDMEALTSQLKEILQNNKVGTKELLGKMQGAYSEEKIVRAAKWLVDKGLIQVDDFSNQMTWRKERPATSQPIGKPNDEDVR